LNVQWHIKNFPGRTGSGRGNGCFSLVMFRSRFAPPYSHALWF